MGIKINMLFEQACKDVEFRLTSENELNVAGSK